MMKILLDLDGWEKEIEVSNYIRSHGRIELGVDTLPKIYGNDTYPIKKMESG